MSDILQSIIIIIGRALFLSMPFFVTAIAMLIALVPLNLFGGWVPAPELGVMAAFFWAVYAPALFPPAAIFSLGLVQDFGSGGPIGFWAIIYLAVYGFTLSQRAFFIGRSVTGVWLGFTAVSALAGIAIWLLASTVYNRWVPPAEIFLQAAVTAVVFLLVGPLFMMLRRAMTTAPERL
jgi:rod shape-determining protein MreD